MRLPFVATFIFCTLFYLWAEVEYNKKAEIVDGECPMYFHRVYAGKCHSRNSEYKSECYNISLAAEEGDFQCMQTKCFNQGLLHKITDIEGFCVRDCPSSLLPGEPPLTIMDGLWCVPNCHEGGTWNISRQNCDYPSTFKNGGESKLKTLETCGKSMISGLDIPN